MTTEQMDADRYNLHKAQLARDLHMDKFIKRITTAVVAFVLASVTVAGIPLLILLYRSVLGE